MALTLIGIVLFCVGLASVVRSYRRMMDVHEMHIKHLQSVVDRLTEENRDYRKVLQEQQP